MTSSCPCWISRICRWKSVAGSNPRCNRSSIALTAAAGVSTSVDVRAAATSFAVVVNWTLRRAVRWVLRWRSQFEPGGERVVGVEQVLRGAGHPGAPGNGWCHCRDSCECSLVDKLAGEAGADERLVDEVGMQVQFAACMQLCHPCAGAGATGGPVEHPRGNDHCVAGMLCRRAGRFHVDVVAVPDFGVAWMYRWILFVDRSADGQAGRHDLVLVCAIERNAQFVDVDDGIEVAAEGTVVGNRAPGRHLNGLVEAEGEGRDIGQG